MAFDTTLLGTYGWLSWDNEAVGAFPPILGAVGLIGGQPPIEILYPIIPEKSNNKLLFRTDNKEWNYTKKSENDWSHQFNKISFRITNAPYMETFYQALEDNKGKVINITLAGVQAFLNPDETNQVYIKSFTKPIRENHVTYTIDVLFLVYPNG